MIVLLLACRGSPEPPHEGSTTASTVPPTSPPPWAVPPTIEYERELSSFAGPVFAELGTDGTSWENVDLLDDQQVYAYADPMLVNNGFSIEGRIDGADLLNVGFRGLWDDRVVVTRGSSQGWSTFEWPSWGDEHNCCGRGSIGELTGDAVDDIVWESFRDGVLGVWLLAGPIDATHDGEAYATLAPTLGVYPGQTLMGDFDADGALDLFVNCATRLALGLGPFPPTEQDLCTEGFVRIDTAGGYGGDMQGYWAPQTSRTSGDFDGDGHDDIVLSVSSSDVRVPGWSGPFFADTSREDTAFRFVQPLPPQPDGSHLVQEAAWITAGDLDDDGFGDLVIDWNSTGSPMEHDRVTISYGPLVGDLDPWEQPLLHREDLGAWTLTLGDLDLDGDDDLVMGIQDNGLEGIDQEGPLIGVFLGPFSL